MPTLSRLELLQEVLTIMPVGVWILDHAGKILYGNPAGQRIWGSELAAGIERFEQCKGWWGTSGKRIKPEEWGAIRAIRKGEVSIDEEIEIEAFDGARKFILHSSMPIRDDSGRIIGAIVVNHDITERKHFEERLRGMAEHDPLTNTFNRRSLFHSLNTEMDRARRYGTPLSLIMFDIDHFKEINDQFGHGAGDKVLIAIAGIVSKKLRSVDQLARFGGEEFLVICPGIGGPQATRLAERLRSEIAAAKIDTLPKITCSFGVCNFSGDEDCDAFVRRVDQRMYDAKQSGRNCVAGA